LLLQFVKQLRAIRRSSHRFSEKDHAQSKT
jgi:hypothetical protein